MMRLNPVQRLGDVVYNLQTGHKFRARARRQDSVVFVSDQYNQRHSTAFEVLEPTGMRRK